MKGSIKQGNFSGLANEYSLSRPDYSKTVLDAISGLFNKHFSKLDIVDVGAGTGIWTRMMNEKKPKSLTAVEPNEDMFNAGVKDSKGLNIDWKQGSAENTSLPDSNFDYVTMASSFHWTDFEQSTAEFKRILRPDGKFTAIWNPRLIEVNPILVEIEAHLSTLKQDIKRVSSGRSGITNHLTDLLLDSGNFYDVVYIEGRHNIEMSKQRYMSAWKSVNDLRSQLGEEKFNLFLKFVENKIESLPSINATYLTRSWTATVNK